MSTTTEAIEEIETEANDAKEQVVEEATTQLAKAKQKAQETLSSANERIHSAMNSAAETAKSGISQIETSFHNRPLAYAGGAFCIGLVLGLAIPAFKRERQALSPLAEKLKSTGDEIAESVESKAKKSQK